MLMDVPRLSRKRRRVFSTVDFGETVCRRLRGARRALLARVDAGVADNDASVSCRVALPKLIGGPGQSDLTPQEAVVSSLPPGDLQASLLRPLPPAEVRRSPAAPVGGQYELWDFAKFRGIAPPGARSTERSHPLSYLDYLSWLQRVLPEGMQPLGSADAESEEAEADPDDKAAEELSGLELLRLLSERARPPSPPRRRGVPPLTADEKELAESSLEPGNASEKLVSRFNVDLTRGQLACLKPGQWLNDEVINFYCKLLEERSKKKTDLPKVWFPNSFFWPKLSGASNSNYSYKEVRRWTVKAKIDIFELDYVIFPMNIGESHWALGAIDFRKRGFRYFDSMFCRPHRNFVPFLQSYLRDEHKAKKSVPFEGAEDWDLIIPDVPTPQQNNGYDCGVFTCFFADFFSAGRELAFDQDDMPDLRLRLAARVVSGNEDW